MALRYLTAALFYFTATAALAQNWTPLSTAGSVSPRTNASAIYDPVTHRMYVFGGRTAGGYTNELWSLDLGTNTWSLIPSNSAKQPTPRHTQVAAFDTANGRMLIWSGQGSTLYNDVWAFNFSDSTWEELFPDGNVNGAPLKRYGTATAFDPVKKHLVTFAGFTTSGRFDDTWSFHTDSLLWKDRTNPIFPLKRCLASQAFAPDRREMIVYGGQSSGNLEDIWTLHADDFTWSNPSPAQRPAGRHFASTIYAGNGRVVIFGGNSLNQGNTAGARNDLWYFSMDDQKWDTLPQPATRPAERYGHTAIYITALDKMIIFGGEGTSLFGDIWEYSGISSFLNSHSEVKKEGMSAYCYPNPSHGTSTLYFHASQPGNAEIQLHDMTGKQIRTYSRYLTHAGFHQLAVTENLPGGIYLLTLKMEGSASLIKWVITPE